MKAECFIQALQKNSKTIVEFDGFLSSRLIHLKVIQCHYDSSAKVKSFRLDIAVPPEINKNSKEDLFVCLTVTIVIGSFVKAWAHLPASTTLTSMGTIIFVLVTQSNQIQALEATLHQLCTEALINALSDSNAGDNSHTD